MIRLCTEADRSILESYLMEEPYGRAIAGAVEASGVDTPFQTV